MSYYAFEDEERKQRPWMWGIKPTMERIRFITGNGALILERSFGIEPDGWIEPIIICDNGIEQPHQWQRYPDGNKTERNRT